MYCICIYISWFSGEKMLMSAEPKGFFTWFIYFLDLLLVRYNYAKFYHFRICVKKFRGRQGPFCPPPPPPTHPRAIPKMSILNRVKQPFAQIRIPESCRNSLRFHWIKDHNTQQKVNYRFSRLVFGLTQSPWSKL